MSPLRERLNTSLKAALKGRDQISISTIRLILAALKDRDIAGRTDGAGGEGIPDDQILSLLLSMVKQRNESAATYRDAGREDLAEREEQEIVIIRSFLPRPLEGGELEAAIGEIVADVGAADIKDMGKVMNALKTRYAGRIDMASASEMVKTRLAG